MRTVPATHLKNRLGTVLREAALGPVAVERHGRVVAWLVPPPAPSPTREAPSSRSLPASRVPAMPYGRAEEARLLALAAGGDLRPSRWRRAGSPRLVAGLAAMLGSVQGYDTVRMLALAERLHPGMSRPEVFEAWLAESPVDPARFLPMLKARRGQARRGRARAA